MRVLIIDDEPIVLQSIKTLVEKIKPDWFVDTCLNASIAQEKLSASHYDILLTDINLPVVSGLDLIKWCKEQNLPINIAVISAYSEFEYAQTAMSMEVRHYILKPIKEDQFTEILNNMEKDCIDARMSFIKQQLDSAIISIPNKSTHVGDVPTDNVIKGIHFVPLLISVGALSKTSLTVSDTSKQKEEWYKDNHLENHLVFHLEKNENVWFFNSPFNTLTVILTLSNPISTERIDELFNIFKNWLQDQSSITILAGSAIEKISDITKTQTEMLSLMPKFIVLGKSSFYSIDTYHEPIHPIKDSIDFKEKTNLLYQYFWENLINYPQVDFGIWKKIIDLWIKNNLSQLDCEAEIEHFVNIGNQNLKNYNLKNFLSDSIYHSLIRIYENILDWDQFRSQSKLLLKKIHKNIVDHSSENVNMSKQLLANEIKQFLESNYQHVLSNNDLKNQFSYSAAHLTNIFKEYYHSTPLDYLHKFRIKIAIRLLKSRPDLNISEIGSQCGFPDPSYFSRAFKKSTGFSPDAYRKKKDF